LKLPLPKSGSASSPNSTPSTASIASSSTTPFATSKPLFPGDETADGSFDNFAHVLTISTAHLERYLSIARQVTRLATGLPPANPKLEKFDIPMQVLQDDRQSEDLLPGSRGGIAIRTHFATPGEYPAKVRRQPSLELANAGACTGNLTCVYTHSLSWLSPAQPIP